MSEVLYTVGNRVNWPEAKLLAAGISSAEIKAAAAAQIVDTCHAQIDALADRVYTPSASRSARYQRKEDEARGYVVAETPVASDYPMLQAEATARGVTVAALAADVVAAANAFAQLAARIEAARATARIQIEAAPSVAAMKAVADAAVRQVQAAISSGD